MLRDVSRSRGEKQDFVLQKYGEVPRSTNKYARSTEKSTFSFLDLDSKTEYKRLELWT